MMCGDTDGLYATVRGMWRRGARDSSDLSCASCFEGEERMHCSRLLMAGRGLPLLCALLLLVGCSSGPAQQATSSPALSPLPSVPVVTSTVVHFSTSDHIRLAGRIFGQGK